jgi:hypothetical protein
MIKKLTNIRDETVYRDEAAGVSYRRLAGGLAWPKLPEPGYLVVVGEVWGRDDDLQARPLRILAERGENTIAGLHRACLELRKLCQVGSWLADLRQKQETGMFLRLNRELQQAVYLEAAPYTRQEPALSVYAQLLLELVQPGRKVLTFGDSSLNGYLMARSPEEMREPAGRFPQLAALGYAAAQLVVQQPLEPGELARLERQAVTTWDRHQWAKGAGR